MVYTKDFERGMREFLRDCLRRNPNDIITDSEMTDEQRLYLEECLNAGFIGGGKILNNRTADGTLHIHIVKPYVTRNGRVFLDNKNPNLLAIIAIIISALSLLTTLAFNTVELWATLLQKSP